MGRALGPVARGAAAVEDIVILGIETAVENVGVAVGDHRGIRAQATVASDRRHAESLAPMVSFVMEQAGLVMSDLSAVAVDVGPGLFTGMRVGIATAKSVAWALELPVVPVCSLDALALQASWADIPVAAAIDARRGEVYWALYAPRPDGNGHVRIVDPVVTPPDDLAVHLADRAEDIVCLGSGFSRHAELFGTPPWMRTTGTGTAHPSASDVVALATQRIVHDDTVDAASVEPMYLRAPDAEINWQTREAAR